MDFNLKGLILSLKRPEKTFFKTWKSAKQTHFDVLQQIQKKSLVVFDEESKTSHEFQSGHRQQKCQHRPIV